MGKAKVAPKHGHTIPRLELCAAVLGVEIYETILDEFELRKVTFFTDSKVVLGYINNETNSTFMSGIVSTVSDVLHTLVNGTIYRQILTRQMMLHALYLQ